MKQTLFLQKFLFAALIMAALPAMGQNTAINPERPTGQEAVYNPSNGTVVITAVAPSTTEYDWETYEQYDLTKIDYISVKRHTPGTPWPDEELGRVVSPAVGQPFEYVDNTIEPDRQYEYSLTAYVGLLKSQQAYARVYTGITPGPLSAFSATTASHEANAIDLTATAPDTASTGAPLQGPLTIRIQLREGFSSFTDLHDIENAEPGKTYHWKYENLAMDKAYTFRAIAIVGTQGESEALEASTYVGLDYPGIPQNLDCKSMGEEAHVSWKAPEKGGRGGNYNAEATTYTLIRVYLDGQEQEVANGIQDTAFIDRPDFTEETAVSYKLVAVNPAGTSQPAKCDFVTVGKAAELPFRESFADAKLQHKGWLTETTQDDPNYTYKAWTFAANNTIYYFPTDETLEVNPQDDDNGLASCIFYGYCTEGQTESLISPHVATNGNDLLLCFYYWFMPANGFKNELKVSTNHDDGEWQSVFSSIGQAGEQPEWREVKVPLEVGNSSNIRVKFEGIFHGTAANVLIDNILIKEELPTSITQVTNDESNAPVEIFTIAGTRVNEITTPGIYIVRKGQVVKKVMMK